MKKLVVLSLMVFGLSLMASAQGKDIYYAEKGSDNFFISLGVGGQVCVNPDNSDYGLGKAITPHFTLSLGKLINPVWGVRAQVAGLTTTLYSTFNGTNTVNEIKNKKFGIIRADALFNISNAISGYKEDRLVNAYAFMGPGLTITKANIAGNEGTKALVGGSLGLGAEFNVSKRVDINVEARGDVSQSPFGDLSSSVADGSVALTAGLTYFFGATKDGKKGGKSFVKVTDMEVYNAVNGDLKKYKELLSLEQSAHATTKAELETEKAKVKEVVVKEVVKVDVAGPRAIFFVIGSSKIDAKGMVNINLAAEVMKANPDVKYNVLGYADKATGSAKYNQKLSERRAKAVYDALVKAGVSESQIEYKGMGGSANLWNNSAALTRVVVIEKAN